MNQVETEKKSYILLLLQGGNARCAHGSPLGPPGSGGRFAAYLVALRATPATIDHDYQ